MYVYIASVLVPMKALARWCRIVMLGAKLPIGSVAGISCRTKWIWMLSRADLHGFPTGGLTLWTQHVVPTTRWGLESSDITERQTISQNNTRKAGSLPQGGAHVEHFT